MCFTASLFDELESIFPDTKTEDGVLNYTVASASGSYPGVQIMLNGLEIGQAITFEIFGPNQNYELYEMLAVPVEYNSGAFERTELLDGYYNKDVIRRAPFLIYEVQKPIINISQATASAMAFTFRVKLSCEKKECQSWSIHVSHGGVTRKLEFVVDAYAVQIPKAGKDTHKYVNWFSYNHLARIHHVEKWSEEYERMLLSYYQVASYTRQNMVNFWMDDLFDLIDGKPVLNKMHFDTMVNLAEKAGIYWFNGGYFAKRKDADWMAKEAQLVIGGAVLPGEGEQVLAHMCKELYAYICEKGLKERWTQSFFDEPLDCSANVYRLGTSIIKEYMPLIPVFEATIAKETIEDTLNIWCPTVKEYEDSLQFFDNRVSKGDRIFVYTCLQPTGNYCNRLLDMERLRCVYLGLAPAKYTNIEGFLHWGGSFLREPTDAYECSVCYTRPTGVFAPMPNNLLPPGDNVIFYPGNVGYAFSSTRAEAHRIGLEDLCLFELLKEKNANLAEQLLSKLFRGYADYEKSVKVYRCVKDNLLKALI